jgi:hypothetical protein
MSAAALIDRVKAAGGRLRIDGGKLKVSAPAPLPDDILAQLRAYKPELLRLLTDRPPCSGCRNLRMAEVPAPGLLPPYRFVWFCSKGHLEHGHTTPDLRLLVAPDSCLAAGDHERAFAKQGEAA